MMKSSLLRDRRGGGERPAVAHKRPQNVGPPPGRGENGLDVLASLAALLEVEVPVRSLADDTGLGGHGEHPAQAATVALGPVEVAGPSSGVARDGHQAGRRGQVAGVHVGGQISSSDDELGSPYRTHDRPGLDELRLRIASKSVADLPVDPPQAVVQGQDLCRQVSDDLGGNVLAGQRGMLRLSRLQGGGRDRVGAADAAVGQPRREPDPGCGAGWRPGSSSRSAGRAHPCGCCRRRPSPVVPLTCVDHGPDLGLGLAHSPLLVPHSMPSARGTPHRHHRRQRPYKARRFQSAVRAPRSTGQPLLGSR